MNYILEVLILLVPLVVSGILHMVVVTLDLFKFLKIPIHQKMFGVNKTIRGFVVMPPLTILGVFLGIFLEELLGITPQLALMNPIALGTLLGLSYCLFELPNSYFKRRKGISPGKSASDNMVFHAILDQADSGFGLIIVYSLFLNSSTAHLFGFMALGVIIHLLINYLLYKAGLRKEPF